MKKRTAAEWADYLAQQREDVARIQAAHVDAHDCQPLCPEDVEAWRRGEPMDKFAFIGIKNGIVYGELVSSVLREAAAR